MTLGICHLDGTIHLAFDHHADPLNYRVSVPGVATDPEGVTWSTNLFGPTTNALGSVGVLSSVTYPYFFNAPNGNLMFYYRQSGSGNGDGMIQEYDGSTGDWTTGLGKFIARSGTYSGALSTNSTSRNPYVNGLTYAGNRLHVSWCWRESAGGSAYNHDLAYAYSDDHGRTWFNSAGTQIGTTGSSFITVNSPGLVVASIPQDSGLSNSYTQFAYPDGSCHVMVAHNITGTSTKRYHHYWRDAAGTWSSGVLPFSGSRPKLVGDDDRSLFLAYSSGNVLRVAKGTPNPSQTAWSWSTIHSQSDTTEGGEGQLDLTRWETDRILTVYGQERYDSSGSPTPLHIFDYQVSAKAILPIPLQDATKVAQSPLLEWTAGLDAVSHRVFLGTNATAVALATTASPEYLGEVTATQFSPTGPLVDTTTYYWRVDEVDSSSEVHQGLVWSFTTDGNFPPTIEPVADQELPWGATSSPEIPVNINDDLTAPAALILSASSSNATLLPGSGITLGGSGAARSIQLAPTAGQTGSSVVTITVDDGTHQTEETFSLTVSNTSYELLSTAEDASVRDAPSVVDVGNGTTLLGTGGSSSNRVDRCTVYVFRLPDFGPATDPFTAATFHFNYEAKQGDLRDNDLYGLARRAAPAVLAGDYYGKTGVPDPAATLLETSILTNTTPFGVLSTSTAGSTALRDYLNAQYAAGAGAGDYVFLRLNTDSFENSIDRATLTMSEGGASSPVDTRPRISVTVDPFTALQQWRLLHFGSAANTGTGSDDADADLDGESNFLEFVTGQQPWSRSAVATTLAPGASSLEFTYTRSVEALDDGVVFTVEWSDTLLPESWSTAGVVQTVDSDDGTLQAVSATVPAGAGSARFVRLRAAQP